MKYVTIATVKKEQALNHFEPKGRLWVTLLCIRWKNKGVKRKPVSPAWKK